MSVEVDVRQTTVGKDRHGATDAALDEMLSLGLMARRRLGNDEGRIRIPIDESERRYTPLVIDDGGGGIHVQNVPQALVECGLEAGADGTPGLMRPLIHGRVRGFDPGPVDPRHSLNLSMRPQGGARRQIDPCGRNDLSGDRSARVREQHLLFIDVAACGERDIA
ncbi:hypothetical protein [Microbacterium testaceum]|uniref:hypothetical protein n=1 Tax=Microbacterium testaceum TaxID=2033 RepID=UPI001F4CBCA0|nr:hypothetical protein [Microbacterium testaceum]